MITNEMLKLEVGCSTEDEVFVVYRVPGGWIYAAKYTTSMVFVPFPAVNKVEVDIDDEDMKKLTTLYGDPGYKVGG